jgi:hypothetical protein
MVDVHRPMNGATATLSATFPASDPPSSLPNPDDDPIDAGSTTNEQDSVTQPSSAQTRRRIRSEGRAQVQRMCSPVGLLSLRKMARGVFEGRTCGRHPVLYWHLHQRLGLDLESVHRADRDPECLRAAVERGVERPQECAVRFVELLLRPTDCAARHMVAGAGIPSHRSDTIPVDRDRVACRTGLRGVAATLAASVMCSISSTSTLATTSEVSGLRRASSE